MGKFKHGKRHTRLYTTYANIKTRCYNTKNIRYKHYGARGITMCDEWLNDFQAFYDWAMANGYQEELTIDRIDVNGNYEPSNCRWVNWRGQQNNRGNNHLIEFNGQVHTMAEWARISEIPYQTLARRINTYGWSVERALTEKVGDSYHCR
jgi:hypothetical protein